jgi:hypothetical protein
VAWSTTIRLVGGDPGADVAPRPDGHAERRAAARRVVLDHRRDLQFIQTLAGHRQADQPAPMRGHEVDHFRGHEFGRAAQIAFVLAGLVIEEDQDLPLAQILDGLFHRGEILRGRCVGFGHRRVPPRRASINDSRYRANKSTSTLTRWPGRRRPSVVCSRV